MFRPSLKDEPTQAPRLEFGPNEFFLMIGLKFGIEQLLAHNSTIHCEVFSGQHCIIFFDLSRAFESHNTRSKGKGKVTLKLTLLSFLYGVLLVREHCSSLLDIRFLQLADDLDMFNSFPWGVPAFEALWSSVLVVDGRLQSDVQKKDKCAFDMCGFTFALQAWAYEVMPHLASFYALRMPDSESMIPRILRWTSMQFFRFDVLK
ncbi:hypothetical protein C2S52_012334 [Perilla frutescens var. hirtella]|nr:hypothetical protein C2S52_012334 [Perilla frutescens var. hirtella]